MRRRYIYDGAANAHEVGSDWTPEPRSDYHIMGDIEPYRSQIDGSIIASRSRHREHLRAHGCIEVGNDSSLRRQPKPSTPPPGLKEKIIRAVERVENRKRR